MSLQPVELNKAYRLLQVGPTTMISAKHNGNANVMAAAWVSLVGINKVMAYIGPQAYTRGLVKESGRRTDPRSQSDGNRFVRR